MNFLNLNLRISKEEPSKRKNFFFIALKILIASGLIIYIINKVNFSEFAEIIRNARPSFLFLGFSLLAGNLYIQFKKSELTCFNFLKEKNKRKILGSLFAGISAGTFTPARVGEYFGRALPFKDKPILQITAATFLDKLYPLIIVALIGAVSSALFIFYYYHVPIYLSLLILILLLSIIFLVIFLAVKPGILETIVGKVFPDNKNLAAYLEKIKPFRNPGRRYSAKMIAFSLIFYFCYISQFSLLIAAYSGNYDFLHYFWAANLVMFTKSLVPSLSFADLGIREGAAVYFLGSMGLPGIVAFDAAITLFFINVLLPSITGIFFMMKKDND